MSEQRETIAVRSGEELNEDAIVSFLRKSLPEFPQDETLTIRQFPAGASNLTYLLESDSFEAVLRRPPFGPLPAKGHDMLREHNLLKALSPKFPYAPRPLVLGEGTDVMDVTFYVMERKHGIVLDSKDSEIVPSREEANRVSERFIDLLAELHQVDPTTGGLEKFGHPEGFTKRQVEGWLKRYEKAKTEDVPGFEELRAWMIREIPPDGEATVIHNDFKLNNMLFSEGYEQVNAVVDWEMATIGDPLFDLGVALGYWAEPNDPPGIRAGFQSVTTHDGFYNRRDLIERYAKKTGRNLDHIHFYQVFAHFKLAVIVQQIYYRWKKGQTQDARFKVYGDMATELIKHANSIRGSYS
ncbi:phosphotransferase family protein [Geomicrobium sediminis]|uniref:Aminoglycoside phosphotransferase (APT) family kinase protein n=1 Tax=Geomicrobium sediminis TaxID=1347788 RepID=A0ABS2P961_9BACL|nr:phosphotransferase family protein [Geomicrobium sediminis]MBM7631378.1 aminoglycoside phosphotransferase (APT) family kinase protein [Geomicrobium sediminis]